MVEGKQQFFPCQCNVNVPSFSFVKYFEPEPMSRGVWKEVPTAFSWISASNLEILGDPVGTINEENSN